MKGGTQGSEFAGGFLIITPKWFDLEQRFWYVVVHLSQVYLRFIYAQVGHERVSRLLATSQGAGFQLIQITREKKNTI